MKQSPATLKPKLTLVEYLIKKNQEKAEITLKQFIAKNSTEKNPENDVAAIAALEKALAIPEVTQGAFLEKDKAEALLKELKE